MKSRTPLLWWVCLQNFSVNRCSWQIVLIFGLVQFQFVSCIVLVEKEEYHRKEECSLVFSLLLESQTIHIPSQAIVIGLLNVAVLLISNQTERFEVSMQGRPYGPAERGGQFVASHFFFG